LEALGIENVEIFWGIWSILWAFCAYNSWLVGLFFPVVVWCTTKNLATLSEIRVAKNLQYCNNVKIFSKFLFEFGRLWLFYELRFRPKSFCPLSVTSVPNFLSAFSPQFFMSSCFSVFEDKRPFMFS
jgi:hypothetical protein